MKTKQKEDKTEDDPVPETSGKTRARKKLNAEPENQEGGKEPPKKKVGRKPAIAKKRQLGVTKTLRSKKTVITKDKVKAVIKPAAKVGRPIQKRGPVSVKRETKEEKPAIIPTSEIKKEPEEPAGSSRSSSPKTSIPRRQRLTSDIQMMRSTLAESPTSLLLGSRTSPYSMRSERSNSPFRPEPTNLRSGRQRKLKNSLLNEIVKKRRIGSDGKPDTSPDADEAKKLKRGRSFSRDGSEVSATESDLSLCETSADIEKDVKTELDLEEEGGPQLSVEHKVPSVASKSESTGTSFSLVDNKQSLKRSTSLDSDNNNRMKTDAASVAATEKPIQVKTETSLFPERNSVLTNMSKKFNTKDMIKNIRKARRVRKAPIANKDKKETKHPEPFIQQQPPEDSFTKEINDLIETLEKCDVPDDNPKPIPEPEPTVSKDSSPDANIKSASRFYSLQSVGSVEISTETPNIVTAVVEENEKSVPVEAEGPAVEAAVKDEDGENIRLQISDEDSQDKTEDSTKENVKTLNAFKPSTQDIDKLMDKLKHFEELDKKRQQELKAKTESVMVTDDVVLIPKSGADIKPLKNIQATIPADKPLDNGSVLSCFQNNSAISIVSKRDHTRKSIDLDLPNSITLIKRNSSSRKESTSSNSGDTISIIEKSLGKDVTLTELRRSVDKPLPVVESAQTLHSMATIQPNKPGTVPQSIATITTSLTKDEKPHTNGSETPKLVKKRDRRSALLNEDDKLKLETINSSLERIKSPPLAESVKSPVIEPIKSPIQTIKPSIETIKSPIQTIKPLIETIKSPIQLNKPSVESIISPTETIKLPIQTIKSPIQTVKSQIETLKSPIESTKPSIQTMKSPIQTIKSPIQTIKSQIEAIKQPIERIKSPIQTIKSQIGTIKPQIESIKSPIEIINPPIETIKSPIERIKSPIQTIKSPIQTIKSQIEPLKPQIENIKSPIQAIKSPPTEVKPVQPLSADEPQTALSTVITSSQDTITVVNIISTDIPMDIAANVNKTLLSKVTSPQTADADVSKMEIDAIKIHTPKEEPLMKLPQTITLKIPSPEAPKETITSPKSEDRKTKSPNKASTSPKETAKLPSPARITKSDAEPTPGTSGMLLETPERQKRKESILRTLGLLTHKAADEAKIEKQKQKEMYANKSNKNVSKMQTAESSGTLRTVIKLNRALNSEDKKKSKNRSSLKMTFQKAKGKPSLDSGDLSESDDTYYTIHKEGTASTSGGSATGGHRKSHYNRFNNNDGNGPEVPTKSPEPAKEELKLVIPEKASSFSIHPGRLCQDQCFYCGGNFGLFDTPCHIAQMKSAEKQKKVLDNEEKLTMDSCLCDACFRHVDRRANCPSYRKRPNLATKPVSASQMPSSVSELVPQEGVDKVAGGRPSVCHAEGCSETADHSIRRKWLIKMRSSVNRVVKLQLDYPGLHTIPLCAAHYRPVSQLMVCTLCRRRLTKHHNIHFVAHPLEELNPRLAEQGVPVTFTEKPAVCKLCRYYCTLLLRPNHNKKHFLKLHRRRLLQTYNIEVPEDSEPETMPEEHPQPKEVMEVDPNIIKQKKKSKSGKSKQRKSIDTSKHEETTEIMHPVNKDPNESQKTVQAMEEEEDIESLISTNKISKGPDVNPPSDNSDGDAVVDVDTTVPASFDKQSELQYLLQKQNNPAQFLQHTLPNLTQKQRNVLKAHNASAIQKPATQAKICDKNAKRIQKIGQTVTQKEKPKKEEEILEGEKKDASGNALKNISLTDECTIESIPPRKSADIAVLKNKWQMSESFTQVKRNLSELSKNVEKPKSKSSDKYLNPVRRLETNPSISVRELFPGEDEMNLQCSIEFNNVKGVTPEGWEKCNATIQYDVETKKLWQELQKPYGNQSSFLRHLVLLEKYFRSGDLILAPAANGHAANYSDSVQSRLRAYDNIPEPPKRTQPSVSLIEYRKQKPSTGKSLLKTNQSTDVVPKSSEPKLPPPVGKPHEHTGKHAKTNFVPFPGMMPAPAVFAKPKSRSVPTTSTATIEMRPPALKQKSAPPPELISIHTPTPQGRKSIENVLKNIQQLVKGVSAPEPELMPVPAPVLPPPPPPLPPPPPPAPAPPKEKKQKTTTKPWRPTLMQITQENLARIAREPTQVAVDGRSLPSLVQVMSGGQRYHITLADYNKMCIMRREKLQQVQVVENSTKTKKSTTEVVTEIQPSTTHGNGGTVTQNVSLSEGQHTDVVMTTTAQQRSEEAIRAETNAVNILKNVGLKNITIAPVVEKPKVTATVTSHSVLPPPVSSSPSLIITSTPMRMPQLGSAVTITSDTLIHPGMIASPILPSYGAAIQPLVMPKIPKSLTVIPQTVPTSPMMSMQNMNIPTTLIPQQILNMPHMAPTTIMNVPVTQQMLPMQATQFQPGAPPIMPQP